ncbi:EAL domain-containing protein [Pandoraea norimbergensis]|uniref:cyclic-guanylate-specific phosphodiesterase n=1 Tax=Pandoraea norimbergensis TaxID=93219 RepID=A0ABN4JG17_9BURK|nr:EAL domain-containing protein [Pandoraea norimbergensis]ALS58990.1 histidine kinase [Pandoraea norimbergensis]
MFRRLSLISASIALGCVGTVLPVLTSIYIAREDAQKREQEDLQQFAAKAVMRAEQVTYQAFAAIADLSAGIEPRCSPAYIARASRVIFNYGYVQDAGAYGDSQYLCSPLLGDVRDKHYVLPAPSWRSNDGYLVWLRQRNPISDVRDDIQFGRDGNYVSINPQSYVDIIDPARRPIAAVNIDTNNIIAMSYGADGDDMLDAWRHGGQIKSDTWHYAVARSSSRPIGVVVKAPRSGLIANWTRLLAVWLAIGVGVGGLIGWLSYKRISRQVSFPATLEWAIARRYIEVHYQPIVRLEDGVCVGSEALVRWNLNGQNIPPDIFVAVAEENDLIQPLTDLVLDKTVRELQELLRAQPSFYVSINVAGEDLQTDRFIKKLDASLSGTGIHPSQIRIEATERGLLKAESARKIIAALRQAGHPVYIDDFGTGYSSLSYLQSFTVDVLKIDKSFVDTIGQGAASSVVAPHIIEMAHELGLGIVAEGVETEAQAEYLKSKGVEYGQGWLFSKAMPAAKLIAWLKARSQNTHNQNGPENTLAH